MISRPWRLVIFAMALISSLTPIIWTLLASLGLQPDQAAATLTGGFGGRLAWKLEPTWDTYRQIQVFESRFVPEVLTSAVIASLTACLSVLIGLLVAHALERQRFAARAWLVRMFLVISSLPVLAFVQGSNATLHLLGWQDTILGITLVEAALYAPLAAFVLYGHLRTLPEHLGDAARLEGAGDWAILRWVIVPSCAQALLASGVLVFVLSWNQVLVPLVLTTNLKLLPVALVDVFVFERELEWPTAAAALSVSLLPLLMFVGLAFRWLEGFRLLAFEER